LVCQQHRRFRFDLRYWALLGCSRRQLEDQLAQGFTFLPPGCRLVLDRVSSERVLANLRQCLPSRRLQLLQELRALAAEGVIGPASGLADWLEALAMEPADIYTASAAPASPPCGASWAGCRPTAASLAASAPPDPDALSERERRQCGMLTAQLYCFSSRRLRLRRSLAATAPAACGGPSIRPWRCSGRQAPGARS